MTNAKIADAFEQVADLLEFQGANPFRVRAYRNLARTIRDLPEPVTAIIDDPARDLTEIPGVGKDLAGKVEQLVHTGRLEMLEELKQQVPESVLDMLRIPGFGPKKAKAVYEQLGVKTLDDLREACLKHQVCQLKGFGEKTEQTILSGLQMPIRSSGNCASTWQPVMRSRSWRWPAVIVAVVRRSVTSIWLSWRPMARPSWIVLVSTPM